MDKTEHAREFVYEAIARLLPSLGKDFNVDISCQVVDGKVRTHVSLIPLTDLGKAIIPYMRKDMRKTLTVIAEERKHG